MKITLVGCDLCEPRLKPSTEPLHDNHYGMAWTPNRHKVFVKLNGELLRGCIEVVPGVGGWALIEMHTPEMCETYGVKLHTEGVVICPCLALGDDVGNLPRIRVEDDGFTVEPQEQGK